MKDLEIMTTMNAIGMRMTIMTMMMTMMRMLMMVMVVVVVMMTTAINPARPFSNLLTHP